MNPSFPTLRSRPLRVLCGPRPERPNAEVLKGSPVCLVLVSPSSSALSRAFCHARLARSSASSQL
eukprot:14144063-Heterocapsa_arctica.AAC.1